MTAKLTPKSPEPIYQAVGAKIRMVRDALGIDQGEIAKRCGMSRPSIANIEAGRQRIMLDQLETICRALGVSVKHFMKRIWL